MDEEQPQLLVETYHKNTQPQIPHCRDDFTLDEAQRFIDELIAILQNASDLANITTVYRTARQLSRIYTMCRDKRMELSQYMNDTGLPRLLTRLIKRLNNIGVFSNDGNWFSSFYLYTISWNFTELNENFATSMGVAGISQLLMLNLGHQPYLTNINSKNVYFLIKASLYILHNIIKIPGNRDMGQFAFGREALVNILSLDDEESLRCVAALCLAHLVNEDEINLIQPQQSERPNLLRILLNQICSASISVKRRYHGFQLVEILTALSALAVNEPIQPAILSMDVEKMPKPGKQLPQNFQPVNCLKFLTDLTDTYMNPESSDEKQREANAAIRIIYHLLFNEDLVNRTKFKNTMKHLLDISRYPTVLERSDKALSRVLENMLWQSQQPHFSSEFIEYRLPEPSHCGPVIVSYSSANQQAVAYFMHQLRAAGLPVWNDTEDMMISHSSAQDTGLSALAATVLDQKSWLQCLNQATVMIACLSDAYRLNPGCRSELEYFIASNNENQPKVLIYIILPPKFRINGWISRMPNVQDAIDFTHKRTFIHNLQVLVARAGRPYGITVADEQLEPLSFELDMQKAYISVEDLQSLKSSSVFLTSSDSEPSRHSVITHTAEQMVSKGSPRVVTPTLSPKHSSDSGTMTSVHSHRSGSQKRAELPRVASVPEEKLKDSFEHEIEDIELTELIRATTPISPIAPDIAQDEEKYDDKLQSQTSAKVAEGPHSTAKSCLVSVDEKLAPDITVMIDKSNEDDGYPKSAESSNGTIKTGTSKSEGYEQINFENTEGKRANDSCANLENKTQENAPKDGEIKRPSVPDQKAKVDDVHSISVESKNTNTTSSERKKFKLDDKRADAVSHKSDHSNEDISTGVSAAKENADKLREEMQSGLMPGMEVPPLANTHGANATGLELEDDHASKMSDIASISAKSLLDVPPCAEQVEVVVPTTSDDVIQEPTGITLITETPDGVMSEEPQLATNLTKVLTTAKEGRTTHMHMKTDLIQDNLEDPADTESNTPDTIEKQTVSTEITKSLSSLNARRSTEKNSRVIRDSSVQTLSALPDLKTLRMTEYSLNAPTELDRLNQLLMLQSQYYQEKINSGATLKDQGELIEPYVREWTEQQVDDWLISKGLPHLSHKLCGNLNGVVLSQLLYLRHWAPEYFAKSVRSELGLGFLESLRFVEALEELKKKS